MRIHELLERNAIRAPNKTFAFSESQSITNREALVLVDKAAVGFWKLGVRKGNRVLMFAPNSIDYIVAMFATFKLGGISAQIDILDLESYRANLKDLAPKLVVTSSRHLRELKRVSLNGTRFVSFDDGAESTHSWKDLLSLPAKKVQPNFGEEAPCHLSYTSGTTYTPKPVVLSHEPTVRATRCIAERLELGPDDTTLGITTLSSSHILVYGILPQMHRGATVGIMESWDPSDAWKMIRDHKVRMISGVAIRLSELADYASEHGTGRENVRLVLSGGSAGIGRIRKKWEELGVRFVETYGMSELGGSVAMGYPHPFMSKPVKPFESIPVIGPPLPDKEVRVVDEHDSEVTAGKPGEIVLRGGFMWGYWKMRQETAKTCRGGWLHTSDIGFMDELDNVYWLARKTDVIRTKSGPIYPRVIEEVLFAHPSVRQACAVGINEDDGQTPVGFVTLFSRGEMPEELLLAHCRSNLDRAFWPSKIVVRDSLPMTPTGKIDKKRLKTE